MIVTLMKKQSRRYDWLGKNYLLLPALCSLFSDRIVGVEAVLESLQRVKANAVMRSTLNVQDHHNRFEIFEHNLKESNLKQKKFTWR